MQCITFTFPEKTQEDRLFFDSLRAILAEVPHAEAGNGTLALAAARPKEAYPVTRFQLGTHTDYPTVAFDSSGKLSRLMQQLQPKDGPQTITAKLGQDSLGPYYETYTGQITLYQLTITEVQRRLQGHVVRIDHAGVNLPAGQLSKQEWDDLVRDTALNCNLYSYPTGEPWLFILPATAQEHRSDISTFPIGREPRFELVYDTFSPVPQIQIDLETDLERHEVERLFPEPYGISFPDLADYFRTIYVHHPWSGLAIRFDIRFKNTSHANDWDTGKWLVRAGGRIQ